MVDQRQTVKEGKFPTLVKVYLVEPSLKFPFGIKAKFLLHDTELNQPRLLVDNHEPFGFHMHTRLPGDHSYRVPLNVKRYEDALELFFDEVERILRND